MTFPVNEKEFMRLWKLAIKNPDELDIKLGEDTVQIINRAYYAGLEDGRKEAVTCKE